jgi:hypothetical protein
MMSSLKTNICYGVRALEAMKVRFHPNPATPGMCVIPLLLRLLGGADG